MIRLRIFAALAITLLMLLVVNNLTANTPKPPKQKEKAKGNPHLLKTRTTSVSVFKNGLGFFMREGRVKKRDGWIMAEKIPPAKFGTLAIFAHNEDETVDVVSSGPGEIVEFDDVDVEDSIEARVERLRGANDLDVDLTYKENGAQRSAAGKLISANEEFTILDTGAQSIAVPTAGIGRMQVLSMPMRIHVDSDEEAADAESQIGIAYLSGGITWIPEYSCKVLDDETAELTLRGTLINQAEDLIHCDVNLVVGVPHFAHTDYMAPISIGQTIRTIGTAVVPQPLQSQFMNRAAIVQNSVVTPQFGSKAVVERQADLNARNVTAALRGLPKIDSAGGSDYTVYTKKDMTLRRGEKAIVTLFTKKIRYSHIYRWTPPGRMNHLLRLHNDTDSAWTTGPYIAISGGRPLSEDLLSYTPKGAYAEILVTEAVNIASNKQEYEDDRELKAHNPSPHVYWDRVTLRGELKLRNFEKRDVDIVIHVQVPGKPLEASDDGQIVSDATQLTLSQREGTASWTMRLEPGEEKTLTYRYERYVSSK